MFSVSTGSSVMHIQYIAGCKGLEARLDDEYGFAFNTGFVLCLILVVVPLNFF